MGLPQEGQEVEITRTKVIHSATSQRRLIVPRRASDRTLASTPPLWGWYSQPNIEGCKGSLIAPLTAPTTPTSFQLETSFHNAIRQRLFNSRSNDGI